MAAAPKKKTIQKPPPGSKREAKNHKLFMRRSYAAYRDLKKRVGRDLLFTLDELRQKIRDAINVESCHYLQCFGEKVTVKNFSVDHDLPISRGGDQVRIYNLIVCSRSANMAKGSMTAEEFRELVKVLQKMEPTASSDVIGRLKAGAAVKRLKFLGRKA